jgi:hypothetical protein
VANSSNWKWFVSSNHKMTSDGNNTGCFAQATTFDLGTVMGMLTK